MTFHEGEFMLWSMWKIRDQWWFPHILFHPFVHAQSIHSTHIHQWCEGTLCTHRADSMEMLKNCGCLPWKNTATMYTTLTSHSWKSNSSEIQNKVKHQNTVPTWHCFFRRCADTWNHFHSIQEMWGPSLGQEDLLEEETATHSSLLAWRIPCTE